MAFARSSVTAVMFSRRFQKSEELSVQRRSLRPISDWVQNQAAMPMLGHDKTDYQPTALATPHSVCACQLSGVNLIVAIEPSA